MEPLLAEKALLEENIMPDYFQAKHPVL